MVSSDKVYEQEDLGPVQSIKQSLSLLLAQIANITKALQDNELQFTTNPDENVSKLLKNLLCWRLKLAQIYIKVK